jgi:prepilin-type N-terminal cleavage/methylation domain-containing protein
MIKRKAFSLVELLVTISIIGILVGLLLPAVQAAREAARRMSCQNNMKQIGLAVANFESAYKKTPTSGQCGSTGSTTTPYMIHSTATYLLPYIEQQALFNMFNMDANPVAAYGAVLQSNGNYLTPSGCLLHPKAKGLAYDDPNHLPGNIAAKTNVPTYVCPTTPISGAGRDPQGYGAFDYMFIDLTDIMEDRTSPLYGERTQPTGTAIWQAQARQGILAAEGGKLSAVTDGTSNTILCIEDAGRANPSVARFGALSARKTPVSSPIDPIPGMTAGNGRRMYAWADADAVTNGLSGPSNSTGSKKAAVNNHKTPLGGPAECPWSVNNCGLNDEPFSFHAGGVVCAMGDGSVKFLGDSIEPVLLKWMVAGNDGNVVDYGD